MLAAHRLRFISTALAFGVGLGSWLGLSGTAKAWGAAGHEVVCALAYAELDPAARAEVDRLLVSGRRGMRKVEGKSARFGDYGPSCAWPDREPRARGQDHYINTRRDAETVTRDSCGENPSCLFSAIERDRAVLRDPASTDQEKLAALMYLGHWIGDLHQPMHVSYGDDRGGNLVAVAAPLDGRPVCRKAHTLHWVWDGCLVEAALAAYGMRRSGLGVKRASRRLHASISRGEREAWRASLDPNTWANESYDLVRNPTVGYCVPAPASARETACWYDEERPQHVQGERAREVVVDEGYVERHAPTVEVRLQQAGVRLGAVLNDVLR